MTELLTPGNWTSYLDSGSISQTYGVNVTTIVISGPNGNNSSTVNSVDVRYYAGPSGNGISEATTIGFWWTLAANNSLDALAFLNVYDSGNNLVSQTVLGTTTYGGGTVSGTGSVLVPQFGHFEFGLDSSIYKGSGALLTVVIPETGTWLALLPIGLFLVWRWRQSPVKQGSGSARTGEGDSLPMNPLVVGADVRRLKLEPGLDHHEVRASLRRLLRDSVGKGACENPNTGAMRCESANAFDRLRVWLGWRISFPLSLAPSPLGRGTLRGRRLANTEALVLRRFCRLEVGDTAGWKPAARLSLGAGTPDLSGRNMLLERVVEKSGRTDCNPSSCRINSAFCALGAAARLVAPLLALLGSAHAQAANPSGQLRIEVNTAYNVIVDSNVETPATYAPQAFFMSAKIWNDGTNDLTGVFAYTGSYSNGNNDLPGSFPRDRSPIYPTIIGPLSVGANTGYFALTLETGTAGVADATRYLGTIKPGEYKPVYWLVSYPNLDINGKAVTGANTVFEDDLGLKYHIWVNAYSGASNLTAVTSNTVTMRRTLSASANKIAPNTANQVPDEYKEILGVYQPNWSNDVNIITPGGTILTRGVWYTLGNVAGGFDNNGDLVPDDNAWLQPVGDASGFDAGTFRLIRTYITLIIKRKDGTIEVLPALDKLYFENLPENTAVFGWVTYEFLALNGATTTQITPYQLAASGNYNEKFCGDYGAGSPASKFLSTQLPEVRMDKSTAQTIITPGSNISYTISYTNNGPVPVGVPAVNMPLVITEKIPAGTFYVAGSAFTNNTLPTNVASYFLLFSTNNGVNWSTNEAPATNVTDIQWWLSDQLKTGAMGAVRFEVTVRNPFTNNSPFLVNTGYLSIGNGGFFTNDTAETLVLGNNGLSGTVFADIGTGGGGFANATQDGAEAGLSNILVSLYYDYNTNGVYDGPDLLLYSTNSATNGFFSFTNLFDGQFLLVVDYLDADLPNGYTATTPTTLVVPLDPFRTNNSPVVTTNRNFGFAPAFYIEKSLVGGSPVYEGHLVTNKIEMFNRLPGAGTGVGTNSYYVYAGAASTDSPTNKSWAFYQYIIGAPDGLSADARFDNAAEVVRVGNFSTPAKPGNITKVEMFFLTQTNGGSHGNNALDITTYTNGVALPTVLSIRCTNFGNGYFFTNITSLKSSWNWSDFNGTTLSNVLSTAKNVKQDLYVDAFGYFITTDSTNGAATPDNTLDPVPVIDYYDADLFTFQFAMPAHATHTVTGTPPNKVGIITWNNVGPIYPGGSSVVYPVFMALEPPGNTSETNATDTAVSTNAFYVSGRPASSNGATLTITLNPSGTLGDRVWRDLNGNGVQDAGEPGIAGVRVTLTGNPTGGNPSVFTDANGNYLFTGLYVNGFYQVTVDTATLPTGFVLTYDYQSPNNNVAGETLGSVSTTNFLLLDFGYQFPTTATIDGKIWNDLNRNGAATNDTLEPFINGVTVNLVSNGVVVATTTTDTNGYFRFSGAYTGSFDVVVVATNAPLGTNWVQSFDSDGTATTNRVTVTVSLGYTTNANFSYYRTGNFTIGDTVYFDWNGNAIQNTNDEGIANITVYLYRDLNSNSVYDPGFDTPVATTVTATNGYYVFTNLPDARYVVVVDRADPDFPPLALMTQHPNETNVCATCNKYAIVNLSVSTNTIDWGFKPYGFGSIGDAVWYDYNGDALKSGTRETNIANILVTLQADFNNDGTFVTITTTNSSSLTGYLFGSLPAGKYRVLVDTNDTDLPLDLFDLRFSLTTPGSYLVTLTNTTSSVLTADFGFAPLGAVGDSLYWDANGNGNQDPGEPGISNVLVRLYIDVNGDGFYDIGDVLASTAITDTNGIYLLTNLVATNYVVVISQTAQTNAPAAFTNATLTADPDSDGVPCTSTNATDCDGQFAFYLPRGGILFGVDFGYQPPGVIGDTIWLDINNNGIRDENEFGIPNITIEVRTTNGVLVATTETDFDGYYTFSNLTNGTYNVVVLTNDVDFPSGLIQNYDPDGVTNNQASNIIISNGVVSSIGGFACTNCYLNVDFGYRYSGTNTLSGTVGIEGFTKNGVMGAGNSGVDEDETPLAGVTLYIYSWTDANTNGVRETSELRTLSSTTTSTNGDYLFTGLPESAGSYIVSMAVPQDFLVLTTTNGATPATNISQTLNSAGYSLSVYQVIPNTSPTIQNVDFAFALAVDFDFSDLPDPYPTLLVDAGARHVNNSTNLILGNIIDTEANGIPRTMADGDDLSNNDDEDGVSLVSGGSWFEGTNGGTLQFKVYGSGRLIGWIDWNNNGSFVNSNDMILNTNVSTGTTNLSFTIPNGSFTNPVSSFYARFRLFPSPPALPALAFDGSASSGEVEDYYLTVGSSNSISGALYEDGGFDNAGNGAFGDTNDIGLAGFTIQLYKDYNRDGIAQASEYVTNTVTTNLGAYSFSGLPNGYYILVATNNPGSVTNVTDEDGITNGRNLIATNVLGGVNLSGMNFLVDNYNASATLAMAREMRAFGAGDGLAVWWQTASEVGSVSFDLFRLNARRTGWIKVNREPVFAADSMLGAAYQVADPGADRSRAQTYRLVETDVQGREHLLGPFTVTPESGMPPATTPNEPAEAVLSAPEIAEARPALRKASLRPALPVRSLASPSDLGTVTRVKLTVAKTGIYRLEAAALADLLGHAEAEVREWFRQGNIGLSSQGRAYAGVLSADGGALYFRGEGYKNNYTGENVYWVEWRTNAGVAVVDGLAPTNLVVSVSQATLEVENDLIAATTLVTDPEQDYWMWHRLRAGNRFTDTAVFNLSADNVAPQGESRLVLRLHGGSDGLHAATVELNGVALGEHQWTGLAANELNLALPPGTLREGANTLRLRAFNRSPPGGSVWYLNNLALHYPRLCVARNGALEFGAEGSPLVTVRGFTTPAITLLDITRPDQPALVTNLTVIWADGSYAMTFAPLNLAGRYAAFQEGAALPVGALSLSIPTGLASGTNQGAYLVVTHDSLADAARPLAQYRETQGLTAKLVTAQQIYDEFNHGLPSPQAIRNFLAQAFRNWSGRPAYVLLAGNGTYDYRNFLKAGDNLVPPAMFATEFGLFCSDSLYGDINGDGLPELAVGRLPAVNAAELQRMIGKIISYEAQPAPATGSALVVAGKPDVANDFPASAAQAGETLTRKFLPQVLDGSIETNVAVMRGALQTSLAGGLDLLAYFGHGAVDSLGMEGYLTKADVPSLPPTARLPVVLAATCLSGQYAVPNANCLAEDLLLKDQGGAIAVIAPTGLSYNRDASRLNLRLANALQANDRPRLGDMVRQSLSVYSRNEQKVTQPWLYNLMGDPATVYNLAKDPAAANLLPEVAIMGPTNKSLSAPAAMVLMAEAYDLDGAVMRVEFYDGANKVGESTTYPYRTTIAGVQAGQREFTAVAIDDTGASATSGVYVAQVTVENLLPQVTLVSPAGGLVLDAPAQVVLQAGASDVDGGVTRLEFYNGTTLLGASTNAAYTLSLSNLAAGQYQFTAVATDNQQARAASETALVTVLPFRIISVRQVGGQLIFQWAGGKPPFRVQAKAGFGPGQSWEDVATVPGGDSTTINLTPAGGFYRVISSE